MIAIAIESLWKRFIVRHNRMETLKDRVVGVLDHRRRERRETFWALRDVTLSVESGETLGLVGPPRREVDRMYRLIVEFAELEDFIDVPVKHYSGGTQARLGFSIAAHLDPDILLIDEVLSVGDEAFQRKCQER